MILGDDSLVDTLVYASTDAVDWFGVDEFLSGEWGSIRFLWIVFPGEDSEAVPRVKEIYFR